AAPRADLQPARPREALERLARGLHPRQLAGQGLDAALAALAGDFPLRVDLTVPGAQTSPDVAACAYFICSEALANVAKHASATAVRISVTPQAGGITVEVADNGAGGAGSGGGGIPGPAAPGEALGRAPSAARPP